MKNKWQYPDELENLIFNKEHQKNVLDKIGQTSNETAGKRKRTYPLVAAFAGIMLVSNFWLFHENIEGVLAKLPYISQFIEQEEDRMERMEIMLEELNSLLDQKNVEMPNWNFGINRDKKVFTVEIKDWVDQKEVIKEPVKDIMKKNGFSDYKLSVVPYQENKVDSDVTEEEIEQYMKDSKALEESLTKRLEEEDFELMFPVNIQMNPTQGVYINVIVPKTETRLDLLESIMKEEGSQYIDKPEIDIRQVEKKAREQEVRWDKTGVISDIARAMTESDTYPVTGFAYSFHPYPLQITIKTSLKPDDPDARSIANEIRSEIKIYIDTAEGTESIRGDEYDINVIGKGKKEID
ncbi:DUF4030 domain-containing protein [Bacillus sp. V3]|nr:DUF4030 domain-containing protein [Bacillus sp. V3]